ncbi:MAG: hypothetical protein ABIA02_02675 [Candidatus Falkowbacteria bacterium]
MIINDDKNNNIKKAIVETIAFFDLFDYPLALFEIWKFINVKCRIEDINQNLDYNFIENKNGFYFLKRRDEIIKKRLDKYNYSDRKFKRALKIAKIFKFIPWIKMIAIGNLIGAHNLKDDSDIDFFVITEKNKIWLTRFFCASFAKILGMRPKENNTRDKICLSFFIGEDSLNLENLMLKNDIYFIYWLAGLSIIYDPDKIYKRFIRKNDWIYKELPNWQSAKNIKKRDAGRKISSTGFYYDLVDIFFGGAEKYIKKFQLKLMPDVLKNNTDKDAVVISDGVLKLHAKDRRREYLKRWREKLLDIGYQIFFN